MLIQNKLSSAIPCNDIIACNIIRGGVSGVWWAIKGGGVEITFYIAMLTYCNENVTAFNLTNKMFL